MVGKQMRSRAVRTVIDRDLLLNRIRDLEGVVNFCNAGHVVSHLRELYKEYACKKLIPFTLYVERVLVDYRQRQMQANVKKSEKEKETNDATPSTRSSKRIRLCSTDSSLSSSAGSVDEQGISDAELKPEFDLMNSSIREAYRKPQLQQIPKCPDKEVGIREDNAPAQAPLRIVENGNAIPVSAGLGKCRESESVGLKKMSSPRFRDLAGMKKILHDLIWAVIVPLFYPQCKITIGMSPSSGILLHGPPGCGKTMLAHAIANETGLAFYKFSATEFVSGVSGASEENIREVFSKAYRTAPSIVFIDEIDAIGSKRDDNLQRGMEKRIVTQLITCMDELHQAVKDAPIIEDDVEKKPGYVLVIGATNRPDALDPALRRPGRFEHEMFLDVPDEKSRREILSLQTEKLKLDGTVNLSRIARATAGFVGADLLALVKQAGILAFKRTIPLGEMEILDKLMKGEEGTGWRQLCRPDELEKLSISMIDFEEAAKLVQPSLKREGFSSIPAVKWEDVGGLDSLRKEFDKKIIQRVKNPEKFEELGLTLDFGFLLYGPPGCGKTLIAKAVANEAGANFIYISGPELLNKYVGESERAVRMLFGRARTCSPCILFFDEIDAVATRRGGDSNSVVDRLLMQLLSELDGADHRSGVVVIGATNQPEAIDPAIRRPGRLGERVYVPLPSPEERVSILNTLTKTKSMAVDVDLTLIAQECENFSGADLSSLVNKSAMLALEETESSGNRGISSLLIKASHFKLARLEVSPSVSLEERKYYDNLSRFF